MHFSFPFIYFLFINSIVSVPFNIREFIAVRGLNYYTRDFEPTSYSLDDIFLGEYVLSSRIFCREFQFTRPYVFQTNAFIPRLCYVGEDPYLVSDGYFTSYYACLTCQDTITVHATARTVTPAIAYRLHPTVSQPSLSWEYTTGSSFPITISDTFSNGLTLYTTYLVSFQLLTSDLTSLFLTNGTILYCPSSVLRFFLQYDFSKAYYMSVGSYDPNYPFVFLPNHPHASFSQCSNDISYHYSFRLLSTKSVLYDPALAQWIVKDHDTSSWTIYNLPIVHAFSMEINLFVQYPQDRHFVCEYLSKIECDPEKYIHHYVNCPHKCIDSVLQLSEYSGYIGSGFNVTSISPVTTGIFSYVLSVLKYYLIELYKLVVNYVKSIIWTAVFDVYYSLPFASYFYIYYHFRDNYISVPITIIISVVFYYLYHF